jgi:hypothetical protein
MSGKLTAVTGAPTDLTFAAQVDPGKATEVYGAIIIHVPNGEMSDNEWGEVVEALAYSAVGAPLGSRAMDGDLALTDGGLIIAGKKTWAATAAPAAGTWAVGDYVRNSAPSVGQPKGWFCTVAGTPGTWVSEGNL